MKKALSLEEKEEERPIDHHVETPENPSKPLEPLAQQLDHDHKPQHPNKCSDDQNIESLKDPIQISSSPLIAASFSLVETLKSSFRNTLFELSSETDAYNESLHKSRILRIAISRWSSKLSSALMLWKNNTRLLLRNNVPEKEELDEKNIEELNREIVIKNLIQATKGKVSNAIQIWHLEVLALKLQKNLSKADEIGGRLREGLA